MIRLLEHAFNAAAMAEDLVKIQRAIVATLTVAALLIAVVPAGAASASTPDLMVQRSPRIWSIDASTAQTLINKDGTRTGWGVRIGASDGGATDPSQQLQGFSGTFTLTVGKTTVTKTFSTTNQNVPQTYIDTSRFPSGVIDLRVEAIAFGDTVAAIYDNPDFAVARWNIQKATTVDNGGCVVAGTPKLIWGDFSIKRWGTTPRAATAVQTLTRHGKIVLSRKLKLSKYAQEVSYKTTWPSHIQVTNWSWNGKIHGKVRPGVYRSNITVTDTGSGKVYRIKKSPGLKVFPASAKTCLNRHYPVRGNS